MKRKTSLAVLVIGVFTMGVLFGPATVQADTVTIPFNSGSSGKGLNPGDVDPSFTWNKTGNFSDLRFQAYVFNNFNPWWCALGFPATLTCNINQGICNAVVNPTNLCFASNTSIPLFGPDVPIGTIDQGIEYYYLTFDLPAGATNVSLQFTLLVADDRLQLQLNGSLIGYWGGSGGNGRMDGLGSEPTIPYPLVFFNPNNVNRPVVTDQSLFNIGGQNVLRFWTNNTGTTSVSAPARQRSGGDPSALQVFGTVTYEVAVDTDGDGLTDAEEDVLGTDPNDPDTDDDGLMDGTEMDIAEGSGCPDPLIPDSDGDTLSDGDEVMTVGTDPCNTDTDGDWLTDDIDPDPLNPGGDPSVIEQQLRDLADIVENFDLSLFDARNDNARRGRRNAMSNKLNAAANATAAGDFQEAIDQLTGSLAKLDGNPGPPDWVVDSDERDLLRSNIEILIFLLETLV